MKFTLVLIGVVYISCCYFCITAEESESVKAVQIISPLNHTFQLKIDELKEILEKDEIKDRKVVVFSIAGAFRKGKSFLLNFFVPYLNAQVNTVELFFFCNLNFISS